MHGSVDHNGALQARGQFNWVPVPATPEPTGDAPQQPPEQPRISSISKLQAQITTNPQQPGAVVLEHEHNGSDYSLSLKAVNMNPVDRPVNKNNFASVTGGFSASYLQSVSQTLAVGAELAVQKQDPRASFEQNLSYCLRWAPAPSALPVPPIVPEGVSSPFMPVNPKDPTQVFTATWAPASGLLHSTYWRRLNQRLEVVAELQMLLTGASKANGPGRREGSV